MPKSVLGGRIESSMVHFQFWRKQTTYTSVLHPTEPESSVYIFGKLTCICSKLCECIKGKSRDSSVKEVDRVDGPYDIVMKSFIIWI